MSWLDNAIEQSASPVDVDISSLGLNGADGKLQESIEVLPLSAAEYQTLKSDPALKGLDTDDKQELLGLKLVHLMVQKCDKTITWNKFSQLPLQTLTQLATAITEAVGLTGGGGALGK